MPNYQKMYHRLFNSQTDAIAILQKAQQETENMYMEAEPPEIIMLNPLKDSENPKMETPDKNE